MEIDVDSWRRRSRIGSPQLLFEGHVMLACLTGLPNSLAASADFLFLILGKETEFKKSFDETW